MFKRLIELACDIAIDTEIMGIDHNDETIRKMRLEFIEIVRGYNIYSNIVFRNADYAPSEMELYIEIAPNGIIHSFGIFYA